MKANKNQHFVFFGADLCVLVPLWQNLQNLNIPSKIINLLLYKSSCLSVFVAKKTQLNIPSKNITFCFLFSISFVPSCLCGKPTQLKQLKAQ
jgi:hypothetical protein